MWNCCKGKVVYIFFSSNNLRPFDATETPIKIRCTYKMCIDWLKNSRILGINQFLSLTLSNRIFDFESHSFVILGFHPNTGFWVLTINEALKSYLHFSSLRSRVSGLHIKSESQIMGFGSDLKSRASDSIHVHSR